MASSASFWLLPWLRKLGAFFSTVVLFYVTITWQQTFKGSLRVNGSRRFACLTVERRHLVSQCSETVGQGDSGPHTFAGFFPHRIKICGLSDCLYAG